MTKRLIQMAATDASTLGPAKLTQNSLQGGQMQNIRNEMLLEQAFLDPKHFRVTGVRCYIDGKPGAPQETPGRSLGASAANAKTVQIVTEVLNSAPLVALSDFAAKGISLRTARTELHLRINHGLVKVVDTKVRRKKLYGWAKK